MNEEAGFLLAIRSAPADDTARLVYADWLDEQPDPNCKPKAAFIRLELRAADASEPSLNRALWLKHLQKLAAELAPAWLATVSRPPLEACRLRFRFECPRRWSDLLPTADPKARHCPSCNESVHYCDTVEEAQGHAARGRCVAVALPLVRQPNDLFAARPAGGTIRLTPEMIERLGRVARCDLVIDSFPLIRPSPEPPRWVPEAAPPPHAPATRKLNARRRRHRRIERENWEEPE